MMLDLEAVRLFVLAAEYGNLTRAAEAAGTVQPVVSVRLKALEAALGRKLLDRTPRYVRLTEVGAHFLERARALLAAHDHAVAPAGTEPVRIAIGISDHALGTAFDVVLRRMRSVLPPFTAFDLRLGQSHEIRELFEAGTIDLGVIRREGVGTGGEVLGDDPLIWCAPPGFEWRESVPLVSLPPPCGVRAVAVRALDKAGIAWRDAFIGGSCLALVAAVRAGLGVAPLGRMIDFGWPQSLGPTDLPPLPSSQIVMLARTPGPVEAAAARALAASVREILRKPASGLRFAP